MCQICGHQEKVPQSLKTEEETKTSVKEEDKKLKLGLKKVSKRFIAFGVLGIILFSGIVLVGLVAYGRVYFYDGYEFTGRLTTLSLILMGIGFVGIIIKLVENAFTKK